MSLNRISSRIVMCIGRCIVEGRIHGELPIWSIILKIGSLLVKYLERILRKAENVVKRIGSPCEIWHNVFLILYRLYYFLLNLGNYSIIFNFCFQLRLLYEAGGKAQHRLSEYFFIPASSWKTCFAKLNLILQLSWN